MMSIEGEHRAVREVVDFSAVEEKHRAIDARLANWGRYWADTPSRFTSPMFRLYRVTKQWDAAAAAVPVREIDVADAKHMMTAVQALPAKHRLAVSWCYIVRDNPRKTAALLGLTMRGLAEMIRDSRQMLRNRGY